MLYEGTVVHGLKQQAIETCGGVKINLHTFLTSPISRNEWSASGFGASTPSYTLPVSVDRFG
jgi:hypothetical protein